MKNTIHLITFAVLFSCVKENDKVSTQNITQNVELSDQYQNLCLSKNVL